MFLSTDANRWGVSQSEKNIYNCYQDKETMRCEKYPYVWIFEVHIFWDYQDPHICSLLLISSPPQKKTIKYWVMFDFISWSLYLVSQTFCQLGLQYTSVFDIIFFHTFFELPGFTWIPICSNAEIPEDFNHTVLDLMAYVPPILFAKELEW